MEFSIYPEIQSFLPPLSVDEERDLRDSIRVEGIRDPVIFVCFNGDRVLVDGHHRYKIASELGIDCPSRELVMSFSSLEEIKYWVLCTQLGRRNLTRQQKALYIGLKYQLLKGGHGGSRTATSKSRKVSEVIAEQEGVSPSYVLRASDFATGVDLIKQVDPGLSELVLSGRSGVSDGTVQKLSKLSKTIEREKLPSLVRSIFVKKTEVDHNQVNQVNQETVPPDFPYFIDYDLIQLHLENSLVMLGLDPKLSARVFQEGFVSVLRSEGVSDESSFIQKKTTSA